MKLKINDRIRNRVVTFFSEVSLSLRLDSVGSTFSLKYYFDPDNQEHKEFSCVGHYHTCTLEDDDGELLFTGIILSIQFFSAAEKQLAQVGGYSLCGVLDDCEVPVDVPHQFDNLSLKEIAQQIIKPFNLRLVVHPSATAEMDEKYAQLEAKESQSITSFLSNTASQKNIILTHNAKGNLLFTKIQKTKPAFRFTKDSIGVISMAFSFNGQAMHSTITVIAQADKDSESNAEQESVKNPFVPIVYRPKVVVQSAGTENDTKKAAENMRAKELKSVQWTIVLDRYKIDDILLSPGMTVTVLNPEIYLYEETTLMIDSIEIKENAKAKGASIKLVIPEVYTGGEPKYVWAGYNLH